MTAQAPEIMMVGDESVPMMAAPLEPLLAQHGLQSFFRDVSRGGLTACHRRYQGTWAIRDGRLWLQSIEGRWPAPTPLSEPVLAAFLRMTGLNAIPAPAVWFSGKLRIPIGERLIQSHHGWSSWYARERVVTIKDGNAVRDREVDTKAMLDWRLKRSAKLRTMLYEPEKLRIRPLAFPERRKH